MPEPDHERYLDQEFIPVSANATIRHLYSRTATVVDTRDSTRVEDWKVFSGTFIRLGNRLFVATVSHSLKSLHNPTRYVVTTKDGYPNANSQSIVVRSVATPSHLPDVGLLELSTSEFESFSKLLAIDANQVSVMPPDNQLATLIGSPAETIRIHKLDDGWGISGVQNGFTTAAMAAKEWPSLSLSKPLDENSDVLVRYPNDSSGIREGSGTPTVLPNPHGVSGGGLWIHSGGAVGAVWTPACCQLVAIQSSWLPEAEYVRLTRIACWLDLIRATYPELEASLLAVDGYE